MRLASIPALMLFLLAKGALAASPEVDEAIKPCVECHGTDGIALKPQTPHLNGQRSYYLQVAMSTLQANQRPSAVKNHVPKAYTDKLIAAIANHYANSTATRPKQVLDPQKVARGSSVYNNKCADCHPDNGRESEKDSPLMAAQNAEYLTAQSKLFVAGKREFAVMMDEGFRGVSEADLDAVSHFFASQDEMAPGGGKKKRKR